MIVYLDTTLHQNHYKRMINRTLIRIILTFQWQMCHWVIASSHWEQNHRCAVSFYVFAQKKAKRCNIQYLCVLIHWRRDRWVSNLISSNRTYPTWSMRNIPNLIYEKQIKARHYKNKTQIILEVPIWYKSFLRGLFCKAKKNGNLHCSIKEDPAPNTAVWKRSRGLGISEYLQ